ncbi:molybdopterin dinucleotide binding domain-containing protein [Pseudonocardia oroxyli]|uniref:Molybdopterin guanine dinucleotide-containing S/N-oxide reductases n=1 Tax=Pseudonocardia oroxyli TaxID=366584 RepID=A0A1G8AIV5_PSEOR|nr:molybdopterin dinucleotide binding domain-containing protein [Pseudonocardia oroxyli]SDH20819.1 molybdopterin guanine dinucleotide-containing S/N-oxide reductases [Pseudonocardia oroxyli]
MSRTHSTHWGAFRGTLTADGLRVVPRAGDPDPSALLDNVPSAVDHPARVRRPAVRRGWWEDGAGPDDRRGRDSYVEVEWDAVLDRVAAELRRYRPEQVYGGCYGWAGAGRFHHAQSQVHRFLNHAVGGYVRSVGDYSGAAAQTVLTHVLGPSELVSKGTVTWDQVAAHTDTVLAFGGMNLKNSAVGGGGISAHLERGALAAAAARGGLLVNVGPLRSDLPEGSRWLSVPPGTDTALMFGLLHTLVEEDLHDRGFLDRYCVGWDTLAAHLRGRDAEWAAEITGVPAAEIRQLARRAAAGRTLVTVAQSLQRAEFGEQPVWAGLALAAALGQIGLPGGGFCYGLGSIGHYGRNRVSVPVAAVPQTPDTGGVIGAFRADPDAHPLPTPSGRIELWSATIDAFGYPDAPGHPTWLPPTEAPDERHPLWLVANQPATRLHSQLDFGAHSRAHKVRGREVARIHPADAGPRGIATGDLVRLSNDRGACLAAAEVTDGVRAGVVQLPTGAWFDPLDPGADVPFCVHGNPNVLTRDRGTSPLHRAAPASTRPSRSSAGTPRSGRSGPSRRRWGERGPAPTWGPGPPGQSAGTCLRTHSTAAAATASWLS